MQLSHAASKRKEAGYDPSMGYWGFMGTVARRAWKEAWGLMIPQSRKEGLRDLALFAFAVMAIYLLKGPLQTHRLIAPDANPVMDYIVAVMVALFATVALFAAYFCVEALLISPYRLWREAKNEVIALTPMAPAIAVDFNSPNWTIHDAFFALDPTLLDDPDESRWEIVGRGIADLCSTMQITAWGRELEIMTHRRGALALIPAPFWEHARLSYWFLDENTDQALHVESRSGPFRQYTDIRFNRASLERAWANHRA